MSVESELQAALLDELTLDSGQRQAAVQALHAWVRSRATVPDTDERLWALLKVLPEWVEGLRLHLDASGWSLRNTARMEPVTLVLERGTLWFRGGFWQPVVLTCVSRKS